MDTCCVYTYSSLTFNEALDTPSLWLAEEDGVVGLDGAPIRSQVDPKGQADGGIVHTKHFGPRIVTFNCFVYIPEELVADRQTVEYRTEVVAVESAVVSALEALLNTESELAWTPAGLGEHTLQASYGTDGGHVQFSGSMVDRTCTFTLIASDPTIDVA